MEDIRHPHTTTKAFHAFYTELKEQWEKNISNKIHSITARSIVENIGQGKTEGCQS